MPNLRSEHSFIIETYFHGQNVEKHKKHKIVTLPFPKFVSFYHLAIPQELRISEIFFAILHTKILIDNIKGVIYLYQKQNDKKITNDQGRFFLSKK